jgi:hypothetical protein
MAPSGRNEGSGLIASHRNIASPNWPVRYPDWWKHGIQHLRLAQS